CALAFKMRGLVDEIGTRRVNLFAAGFQDRGDRMLRQPADLNFGMLLAQLLRDRKVALRVAEPDRRRNEKRTLRAASLGVRLRRRESNKIAYREIDCDRNARVRQMPRIGQLDKRRVRRLS